ncbi:MAG TPA: NADH-quinone oxidoreductase subunit N [Ktedonobacter sp.]|nr:NADH-quinone oxidoreductase subunit N [Ktedonobacter sp.]
MTFTFMVSAADWGRIAPELVLVVFTLLTMIADLLLPQEGRSSKERGAANFFVLPVVSAIGVLGALAATIVLFIVGDHQQAFNHMIGSDWGTLYAYLAVLSASLLAILFSPAYLKRLKLVHQGEYYALMLLATIGMMLLTAATSFLTVFLGIEMLSLALYILCGFVARRRSSQESGMKYFLLSSFASAFLLYGIALTYGATGNTSFNGVRSFLAQGIQPLTHNSVGVAPFATHTMLLVAMGLLTVGFAFKVSAIPFQAWTPDVYEGAPAPVTAFMSVGTKAAAIIAFARVFVVALFGVHYDWFPIIETVTILTIVGGNVLALVQGNLKRMLAYSSIAHAGYLLIGIVATTAFDGTSGPLLGAGYRGTGLSAILFYLLCYTFLNMGAFGAVSLLERADNSGNSLQDLRGLWYRRPLVAGTLAIFLLGLAGFPPMSGFAGKYYMFYAALAGGHPELLIIGVLASILGMYYYLRFIAVMFMEGDNAVSQALGLGTLPAVPTTPRFPATPRAVPAKPATGGLRTSTSSLRSGSTAVATKPVSTKLSTAAGTTKTMETTVESDANGTTGLNWMTWTGIGIALVGTFAMGTILPFWLVNLAQQAAAMMIR